MFRIPEFGTITKSMFDFANLKHNLIGNQELNSFQVILSYNFKYENNKIL